MVLQLRLVPGEHTAALWCWHCCWSGLGAGLPLAGHGWLRASCMALVCCVGMLSVSSAVTACCAASAACCPCSWLLHCWRLLHPWRWPRCGGSTWCSNQELALSTHCCSGGAGQWGVCRRSCCMACKPCCAGGW